jgi:tetratricopeptide (TPR) repeat protein
MERGLVLRQHFFGADSDEVWRACKSVGEMCNLLAMTYLQQQDFDMALELLKKAEILTERDDAGKAVTFNNLACFFRRQGKLNQALTNLQKALKIEARLDDVKNAADTHLNMCAVLSQLGHHSAALEHAQSALIHMQDELFSDTEKPMSEKADRVAVLGICYHNIGVEQEFLKKFTDSLNSYRKGVEVASQHLGPSHGITITLKNSMVAAKKALALHKQKEKVLKGRSAGGTNKKRTNRTKKGRGQGTNTNSLARSGGILGNSQSMPTLATSMDMDSSIMSSVDTREVEEARRLEQSQPRALRRGAPGPAAAAAAGGKTATNNQQDEAVATMPKFPANSTCLVKPFLTDSVFSDLKAKVTNTDGGVGLGVVLRSAVLKPEGGVGAYAGDQSCFETFKSLLHPLISSIHGADRIALTSSSIPVFDPNKLVTPKSSMSAMSGEAGVVQHMKLVAIRSIAGVAFMAPALNPDMRKAVEQKVRGALLTMAGGDGKYAPLAQMLDSDATAEAMMKGDDYWVAAGGGADWPNGRGVFTSPQLTVQVNGGSGGHLQITAETSPGAGGADLKEMCSKLAGVEASLKKEGMGYARDTTNGYGHLNADLRQLGSALTVTVRMALPLTSKEPAFNDLLDNYELEAVSVPGGEDGLFDIRNRHAMGSTEEKLIQHVFDGAAFFANIELEQRDM